jgi:hypothetical protein
MRTVLAFVSLTLIVLILWDSFESMVFPRRVTRAIRPTRFFYRSTWMVWSLVARRMQPGRRRETLLSVFGPLSLLALFATWVAVLIFAFALLHWSLATPMHAPEDHGDFDLYWYLSGTTFFTLGYGDVVLPMSWRLLGPFEGAVGILMFGWSTGIMVAAITRIYGNRLRLLSE